MSAFLYYLPDYPKGLVSELADIPVETGLRDVLYDATGFSCGFSPGPNGTQGMLFSANPCVDTKLPPPASDYRPDEQRWVECKAGDKTTHWVGVWTKAPPTPNDLRRELRHIVDGHMLTLLDGQEWLVPVLGPMRSALPREPFMDADGKMGMAAPEKFDAICKRSEFWFNKPEGQKATFGDAFTFFADVMAVNYRIGLREAMRPVLHLVNSDLFQLEFIQIVCGWKDYWLEQEQKKNQVALVAS